MFQIIAQTQYGIRIKKFVLCVLLLVAIPARVFGFSVEAQVDANQISQDRSLTLNVIVKGGDALVDTSVIKGFKVVPRGTSTSVSIINGAYSRSVTHQYLLTAEQPGTLTIPPLPVTLDGEIAYTDEIRVEVVKGQVTQTASRDVFARSTLSRTTLVPGQQAIYTFRLYSAVQVANPRLAHPEFKGFSVKQAPDQESFNETVNGRSYTVTELTYVLVAEKPGTLEIEPSIVTCDIPVAGQNSPFNDPFFGNRLFSMGRHETRRFATDSFQVTVKPMPVPGKGVNFSGLVGHFSLGAGLDRTSVRAGDSVTLTVTVSGTGNVMDAPIPVVNLPDSFKVYEDVPQEKITLTQEGYKGDKTFKQAIVPVAPGEFSIEPVTLTYFNIDTQDYETLSTPGFSLTVESAAPGDTPVTQASAKKAEEEVKKQAVEFIGDDILALKEGAGVLVAQRSLSLNRFVLLLALPLVLLLVFRVANNFFKKEESFASLMERKARQALKTAGTKNLPDQDFLRNLYMALVAKVRSRGKLPGETITAGEISQILSGAGCNDRQIQAAIAMLHDIESARYGGALFDSNLKKNLLQRVKQLALCIVCLGFFAAVPGPGRADDSGTLFLQGVNLYKAGQFQEAAVAFEKVAANGIKNGQLYYNIGNACLKAGDLGHAILWYERAVKLTPRDPDLRYNLDHARGLVTDVAPERNIDILSLIFFWDNYLPIGTVAYGAVFLWFCFVVHIGVRMFRRKRVFTLVGSILCVLSVVVVATAFFNYYHQYAQSQAIILADGAPVRSGYSDEATELFILHAGTKVRVERAEKAFLRISFSKDKVGWVKASLAGII
ncbi:conserved hypothetical protein [Desulforapulum autotrophicum HRM2]|uniref:Uncharacterized protein n=1 Tax=Desulforapulum autotrophicum (strain ATCC 43914 / DSM 3382 / VKM B-1955 / HRM2) TaxID=177437 RepID=C0QK09_DESAH|nr:BatD family protein [Desulforapulum autotrophicum]ACN16035.1 conserved hypothetical protein [Desulforapulum autotrophicum HRM2]